MYDDYDLDYSYTPEYTYDLDETYDMWVQSYAHTHLDDMDLDEDYAHNTQDYDALAYKHYAWYNLVHIRRGIMYAHMLAQKRRVSVTLDVECYDDLYLQEVLADLDWKELLDLEGDENVDITIKERDVAW